MTNSRLYYEAHITVDSDKPIQQGKVFSDFSEMTSKDFKTSMFDEDNVDDYNGKWFASARSTNLDLMKLKIKNQVDFYNKNNYPVIRWKIEDTVLDSKYGDTLD